MYFWKTRNLATDIKNGKISEYNKKNYFLATSILALIAGIIGQLSRSHIPQSQVLVECLFFLIITIVGITITFKTNKGNDGIDYVARMIALSLPLLIKMAIMLFVFAAVIGIIDKKLGDNMTTLDWHTIGLATILKIWLFWRLNVHLKYINK